MPHTQTSWPFTSWPRLQSPLTTSPKERQRCGRRNRIICSASTLNDDGMAACGFSRNILDTKNAKFIFRSFTWLNQANENNNFWKDCEKRYSSIKLLKDTFEWMNEFEWNWTFNALKPQKALFQCQIMYVFLAHSGLFVQLSRHLAMDCLIKLPLCPYLTWKLSKLSRFASCAFCAPWPGLCTFYGMRWTSWPLSFWTMFCAKHCIAFPICSI